MILDHDIIDGYRYFANVVWIKANVDKPGLTGILLWIMDQSPGKKSIFDPLSNSIYFFDTTKPQQGHTVDGSDIHLSIR